MSPQEQNTDNTVKASVITVIGLIAVALITSIIAPFVIKSIESTPTPTVISSNTIFTLQNAKSDDFYAIRNATFVILNDNNLAITGTFADGTYLNTPMPKNFRATVRFKTEDPKENFILGLGNGTAVQPNYDFVMTQGWTAFKQQQAMNVTNWDKEIRYVTTPNFLLKPNVIYEVIFERKNGGITVSINNVTVFAFGAQDLQDISKFDYLYLTGATEKQIIIDRLIIENVK